MIVMKFGGSALQTAQGVRDVAAIVQNHLNERPILVLSAMGNTTDDLISVAQQRSSLSDVVNYHRAIMEELDLPETVIESLLDEMASAGKQSLSHLLSFGERLSVRIFSAYLNGQRMEAAYFDGWDAGILSSSDPTRAQILPDTYERVPRALSHMGTCIPVITGFIAKDKKGCVTTLGRGGSDLTASVVAKALAATEVQLWKDVDGILSADPRFVPDARPIPDLTFFEASELARYGAKILHPDSIRPAMEAQIPVRVKNYRNPAHPGTLIGSREGSRGRFLVAIAHTSHQALVHIDLHEGASTAPALQVLHELGVDVVEANDKGLSVLVEVAVLPSLQERFLSMALVTVEPARSCVSLIGSCTGSDVVEALQHEGVAVLKSFDAKLVVSDDDVKRCVEIIHRRFCGE